MRENSEESGQEATTEQQERDPWIRDAELIAVQTLLGGSGTPRLVSH